MSDLFKDIIPSILQTKKNVLDNEKDYVPFVVNKALSHHYDCIMYANEMNMNPNIPRNLQYQYFLNTVRPYKRPYQKWHRAVDSTNLDIIKEYYKCSNEKARDILDLLSQEHIDDIKRKVNKGGKNGGFK